jgi:hypothetical protein
MSSRGRRWSDFDWVTTLLWAVFYLFMFGLAVQVGLVLGHILASLGLM